MCKGNGGISKSMQEMTNDIRRGNVTARDQVKQFASLLIHGSEISAQEAAGFLLGIPNTNCSRQDVFINTDLPEERVFMLKPQDEIEDMDDNATEIRCKNLLDYYVLRPDELEDTCLAEFASMFERVNKTRENKENARANQSTTLKLKKNAGFLRRRIVRKIVRYRHYGKNEDLKKLL